MIPYCSGRQSHMTVYFGKYWVLYMNFAHYKLTIYMIAALDTIESIRRGDDGRCAWVI